jgi:ubiquinone biosynthesis monooxygenase Coq7
MTQDAAIAAVDSALRTLFARLPSNRPSPVTLGDAPALTAPERAHAAALMRINHVGEVCAQALYTAQALATGNEALRAHFIKAGKEEADHLAWTQTRLDELGSRPSLLNPLWYGGAFAMGLVAGRLGDAISLGFVEETERQVQAHLEGHLEGKLPDNDRASRAVVEQMRQDEMAHGAEAHALGAEEMPLAIQNLMRVAAKVMTTVAYRI